MSGNNEEFELALEHGYLSSAKRRFRAQKKFEELSANKESPLNPVKVSPRGALCRSFWGKNWCRKIECYPDSEFRLNQGRTTLRCNEVLDLTIEQGQVAMLVLGIDLHRVRIEINAIRQETLDRLAEALTQSPLSLLQLLEGDFSDEMTTILTETPGGIFPEQDEIRFDCDCFDAANLCQHVAAGLYAIARIFDSNPNLFFELRGFDPKRLTEHLTKLSGTKKCDKREKAQLDQSTLEDVFGIELSSQI